MSTHDDNLYSRQIGAVGKNTMDKLMNLKICIIGAGPHEDKKQLNVYLL